MAGDDQQEVLLKSILDKLTVVADNASEDGYSLTADKKEYYSKIAEIFAEAMEGIMSSPADTGPSAPERGNINEDRPSEVIESAAPVRVESVSDDVLKALQKYQTVEKSPVPENTTGSQSGKSKSGILDMLGIGGLVGGLAALAPIAGILLALRELGNIDLPEGFQNAANTLLGKGQGILQLLTKGIAKGFIKRIFKSGAKFSLKQIPVIGGLFSLGFGLNDIIKHQDYTSGVINIIAGIADLLAFTPLAPIAMPLSMGLDVLNAFLDLKFGTGKESGERKWDYIKGVFVDATTGLFNTIKPVLRYVPIIGTFIRVGEGIEHFKNGKWVRGIVSMAGALAVALGPAGAAGADFLMSLFDAKDKQDETFKQTGKKISFGQALKEVIFGNIKKYVAHLPGWVRAAMKKVPGMAEFVGNVEAQELSGLESMAAQGNITAKDEKRLKKLRLEKMKKMAKLKDFEDKWAEEDYGWGIGDRKKIRGKEIEQLRKEIGLDPGQSIMMLKKEHNKRVAASQQATALPAKRNEPSVLPVAEKAKHPAMDKRQQEYTDPDHWSVEIGKHNQQVIDELKRGNDLLRQQLESSDSTGSPVINNTTTNIRSRSKETSVDDFQTKVMK
jgi:hypothetical protein